MVIELAKLGMEGKRLTGEDPASVLDLAPSRDIRVAGPVRYDVVAARTGESVIVKGALAADLELCCSRCAEPFPFCAQAGDFEAVQEVAPGAESVDLTEAVRETILLAFPNYPVCRAECKGLCGRCGANLNESACRCAPTRDARWSALERL